MEIDNDQKSWFEKQFSKIENMLKVFKPKNVAMTLEDGTVVQINSEEGPAQGVTVTTEDGQPLPAGTYKTVDGIEMTVDENSTITQVSEMETTDDVQKQLADKDSEIQQLKEQLAAKTQEGEASQQQSAEAINNMKKELDEVKTKFEAFVKKPFGDASKPNEGDPNKKFKDQEKVYDPMAEQLGNAWLSNRF